MCLCALTLSIRHAHSADGSGGELQGDTSSTRQRTAMLVQMHSADANIDARPAPSTLTGSSLGTTVRPSTLGSDDSQDQLKQALDNMRLASPPEAFARRYQLLAERVAGGQGVVQVRQLLTAPVRLRIACQLRRADRSPCKVQRAWACVRS